MSGRPLAIVGFMASGKTTLGRRLAHSLSREFFDLDQLLVEESGMSIRAMILKEGEDAFRELECSIFSRVVTGGGVLSTGGGIVERSENRKLLRERCDVVWLDALFELIRQRLRSPDSPNQRPLVDLLGMDELRSLHFRRRPLYAAVADLRVELRANLAPARLARQVLRDLSQLDPPAVSA